MKVAVIALLTLICTSARCQQYNYDQNGNLEKDTNKRIAYFHYNYLNLVDTIVFEDGREIIYTYSALGQKLSQQVFLANDSLKGRRDYAGGFLYRDNLLQEIHHNNGRLVPVNAGDPNSSFIYHHHTTDHLGNVRNTITASASTVTYTATMESTNATQEEILFTGLSARRITFPAANTTPEGEDVVLLMNNTEDGLSISIPVKGRDIVNVSVNGFYGNAVGETPPPRPDINSLLTMALSAITGGALLGTESQQTMLTSSGTAGGVIIEDNSAGIVPLAYLNYVLMDRDNNFVDGGFVGLTQAAATAPEHLQIDAIRIKRSGVLRVFLSNTSEQPIPAYFDDLRIEHIPTPVIQENSYYPFGLTLAEQDDGRFGEEENRYLFNGKEFQDDLDLNWSDYGARMYDPALGRWHVGDPLAKKYPSWSSYSYVMNNPLKFVDPDGKEVVDYKNDKPGLHIASPEEVDNFLRSTPTGREIMEKVERSSHKVYRTFRTPGPFEEGVYGSHLKLSKLMPLAIKTNENGESSLGVESPEFATLNGMKLSSEDVNNAKNTSFIAVEYQGNIAVVAFVLAHEYFHADSDPNDNEAKQHEDFGSAHAPGFYMGVDQKTYQRKIEVRAPSDMRKGSIADKLAHELAVQLHHRLQDSKIKK